MRTGHRMIIGAALCMALGLTGCGSMGSSTGASFLYKNITVADGSTVAGEGHTVLYKGSRLALSGTSIKVGDPHREREPAPTDPGPIPITYTKGKGQVP